MNKNNLLIGLLLALLLSGCAAQRAYQNGQDLVSEGRAEEGLAQMEKAYKLEPGNSEYRGQYFKLREATAFQWLSQAREAKNKAAWDEAEGYYNRVLKIDPDNPRAKIELSSLGTDKKQAQLLDEAKSKLEKGDVAGASKNIHQVLAESPSQPAALKMKKVVDTRMALASQPDAILKSKFTHPISMEFKDAPIQTIFDFISKVANVNIIFDKEVRPDLHANLFVRDARIEDVIRFLLVSNQLEQRILNGNTLFIYPNTPQKLKDFQELQIKNFYLVNASAKDIAAMLKGIVKTKDIYVNEKANLIVMRDTPDAIRVAERLVAAEDVAEPEVMLAVEVLEVGTNVLDTLGIQYPSQLSFSVVGSAGTAGSATLADIRHRNSGMVRVSISDPAVIISMLHQDGNTNLMANPRIRVKNHEKANIHIGDRVPVITNTTSNGVIAQSVNYLDVGLKLDVEPTVYLDNDVGIKVGLEVSSITKQVQDANGTLTYQIGTRNASTVLRLKDGETQLLAGLINKEDRQSVNGIPGLGQLPVLGRLFSNHSDSATKTEVVLLITPHVVRNIVPSESPIEEFASGTESAISLSRIEIGQTEDAKVAQAGSDKAPANPDSAAAKNPPAAAAAAVPALAAGNAKLALDVPPKVPVGKEFTVTIKLTAGGVQNAMLDLLFDPAKLKVVRVTEGDFFKKPDDKTQFLQQVQDKAGVINLSVIRQGNAQGEGALASVTFQPLDGAVGNTQLSAGAANFSDAVGHVLPTDALPVVALEIAK